MWDIEVSRLEKIRFSITRLKLQNPVVITLRNIPWKDKILDYEIEISSSILCWHRFSTAWKDKILDYEIEIEIIDTSQYDSVCLEKIRFSITRLKFDEVWDDLLTRHAGGLKR